MKNKIEEETIPACWVCGKVWKRKDYIRWVYFNEMVICLAHKGAAKWYNAAVKLGEQKIKYECGGK